MEAQHFKTALFDLAGTLMDLYLAALLLRILLQARGAEFHNPVSQFIWRLTSPVVAPLARWIPKWRRIDVAACVVLLLGALAAIYLGMWMYERPSWNEASPYWLALLKICWVAINLYVVTMILQCLLSWFGAGANTAAGSVLWVLNEPFLRPLRRVLPPMSGFDLTPLVSAMALRFVAISLDLAGWFQ